MRKLASGVTLATILALPAQAATLGVYTSTQRPEVGGGTVTLDGAIEPGGYICKLSTSCKGGLREQAVLIG